MIDSDGYTKLCDFGLSLAPQNIHPEQSIADDASSSSSVSSSSVTSMTTSKEGKKVSTTTFFGTLEYLPPEFFHKAVMGVFIWIDFVPLSPKLPLSIQESTTNSTKRKSCEVVFFARKGEKRKTMP